MLPLEAANSLRRIKSQGDAAGLAHDMIWYQLISVSILTTSPLLLNLVLSFTGRSFLLFCLNSVLFPLVLLLHLSLHASLLPVSDKAARTISAFNGLLHSSGRTDRHEDITETIASRRWKDVLTSITFYPQDLLIVEKKKPTALHHACLFQAPANVIELMLLQAPELADRKNVEGEIPLHWAVRLGLSNQILRMLLEASPSSGVFAQDRDGNTPLALLWASHQDSVLRAWWNGREFLAKSAAWNRILFLVKSCHYGSTHHPLGSDDKLLHIAARYPCPPALFPLILNVYKTHIGIQDENGQTVLAAACSDPVGNRHCDVLTKIELVLGEQSGVASASVPDSSGRVPFLIAVAAGIAWEEGVQRLFDFDSSVLTKKDPVSGLYAFMLAGAGSKQRYRPTRSGATGWFVEDTINEDARSLTTIYNLLRADPMQCCGLPARQ